MQDRDLTIVEDRANWVRLRTLILVRWIAVAGQISALVVANFVLGIDAHLGYCSLLIAASAALNIGLGFAYPANKRMSALQATLMLLFDIGQLAGLLALTGGLDNPFSMLMLAPVTIAATVLPLRHLLLVAGVALILTSLVAVCHIQLSFVTGEVIEVSRFMTFGFFVAIVICTLFFSAYARSVSTEVHSMSEALQAMQMALAREQKLTDLAGVVAAAAHELGTPLATIKLTSKEMLSDLKDRPDLAEDARLIVAQADRCRDILRSMGRAGKRDSYIARAGLSEVLREAAEPHLDRGKEVIFNPDPALDTGPVVERRPEVIRGLRNLIQNAVDFAESRVWVEFVLGGDTLEVQVLDDGPGFPPAQISRLGDPFLPRRDRPETPARPEYEGMGLGLFIAKSLLERTGAELEFVNHRRSNHGGQGAMVRVVWPADKMILTSQVTELAPPEDNQQIVD